jgi:RHS repeat-associated protein
LKKTTASFEKKHRIFFGKERFGTVTQNYYDDGRIKDNTIGTYNYANTAKKYQNTSVTLSTDALAYYKNRGIAALPSPTATRALNITYNTFKSPVEITEDGVDKLSFVYNDNNSRSAMFYGSTHTDKNLRPLRKYYSADGSMEIKHNIQTGTVEFVTYIGGDGYSAPVVYKKTFNTAGNAQEQMLYLHRDYQGSILAITNEVGTIVEKRLFDAWGSLLSIQNGSSQPIANGQWLLDRGYTGHEHLQSVGLIHMNGRLYDPKLHRFLQPDNYVQDPSNTQNYNRYSYVLNNPLKYTDPSGEFWHIVIGAAIGGVVNWVAHGAQFNAKGLAYFGVGAAAGALTAMGAGGVSSALAGGSFSAGALGTAAAMSVGSGFVSGAVVGAAGGLVGGFTTGFGNALVDGKGLGDAFKYGIRDGAIGAITGGIVGGLAGGIKASREGTNFWTGEGTSEMNASDFSLLDDGKGSVEYSNESAHSFSNSHKELNRWSSNVDNLYADGTVPSGYSMKNGFIVTPKSVEAYGLTTRTGWFTKTTNVYLSEAAFSSRAQLYATMNHEYMHAYFYANGSPFSKVVEHKIINQMTHDQSRLWNVKVNYDPKSALGYPGFHYSQYGFKIIKNLP